MNFSKNRKIFCKTAPFLNFKSKFRNLNTIIHAIEREETEPVCVRIRAVDSEPIDENDRWPSDAQISYYSSSELWKFKETTNYKNLNRRFQCDWRMWMYFNAFYWIWNWIFWPLIFRNKSQRSELPRFPSIFSFCDCE